MDYNEDPDPFCRDCAGWRKKADRLEAQLAAVEDRLSSANNSVTILETRLAAVEKERDEARDLHARAGLTKEGT